MLELDQYSTPNLANHDAVPSLYIWSSDFYADLLFWVITLPPFDTILPSLDIICTFLDDIMPDPGQYSTSKLANRDAFAYLYILKVANSMPICRFEQYHYLRSAPARPTTDIIIIRTSPSQTKPDLGQYSTSKLENRTTGAYLILLSSEFYADLPFWDITLYSI